MKHLVAIALVLLLSGCANPLNRVTYERYTDTGDRALAAGEFSVAEAAYARAAYNVDWGLLGDAPKSGSLFNLANAKLRLGKFAEAEPLLLESIRLEEKLGNKGDDRMQKRYIGLSIVYLELGQIDKGLPYLRKTLPYADNPGFPGLKTRSYPAYIKKLEALGRTEEANEFRK